MEPYQKRKDSNWLNSKQKERGREETHIADTIIFSNLFYRSGRKIIK
jgi:hypothetical protein